MSDGYTRLIAISGQTFDFTDTAENYMSSSPENEIFDDVSYMITKRDKDVPKEEVDILKLTSSIQDIFFDLYGTNVPKDKLDEIYDTIPDMIPNEIQQFEFMLVDTLRKSKIFEWVDTQKEDDVTAPQQLQEEVDEIVDLGNTGDIHETDLDTMLEEETPDEEEDVDLTQKLSPVEQEKLTKSVAADVAKAKALNNKPKGTINSGRQPRNLQHVKETQAKRNSDAGLSDWDSDEGSAPSNNKALSSDGFPILNCDDWF